MSTDIENITVDIDVESTELDAVSRRIVGPIYVAVGDGYFPEQGWRDFVGSILAAWTTEIRKLIADPTHVAECYFLDGPYWFELEYVSSGKWRFIAYERSREKSRLKTIEGFVSASTMVAQLSSALKKVLATCTRAKWDTPDSEALSESIHLLNPDALH